LRLIDSPYVYKFEEMFEEEESYVFVLEYLPGKDLMSLYK
jgi:serine/threonine protein kinase